MNLVATQQVALENSLVTPKKRLKIEKYNAIIAFSKPQREETYQVTLVALKLSPCYHAFLITTKCGAMIPDVMINQAIKDSKASKNYYDFATRKATPKKAMKYKKVALPSRKLSPVLEEEPAEKPKRAKKPSKKSTTMSTAGVVIRDNPSVSVSNKKGPPKGNRGKDMELLSDVALLKVIELVPNQRDSDDDESNDDDSDEVTKYDDEDDVKSYANEDKEASDSEKANSNDTEFEKKAQAEKEKYIDIIEKLVKEIIKDEVKT
nr:hypothetical protein [Tanacetum cinerariifolium]